jgi:hypothetical protein
MPDPAITIMNDEAGDPVIAAHFASQNAFHRHRPAPLGHPLVRSSNVVGAALVARTARATFPSNPIRHLPCGVQSESGRRGNFRQAAEEEIETSETADSELVVFPGISALTLFVPFGETIVPADWTFARMFSPCSAGRSRHSRHSAIAP